MIKALVVDDERIVRQGILSLTDWTQFNIEFVAEAKDGMQALAKLEEHEVDLMFVDITMPHMNGFELIKRVQQTHPHIKFIIITCHHEFDDVKEALQLGVLDYIVKTLLDRENVIDIMHKIKDRFDREQQHSIGQANMAYDGGLFYVTQKAIDEPSILHLCEQLNTTFIEVSKNVYLARKINVSLLSRHDLSAHKNSGVWVSIPALKHVNETRVIKWLTEHIHTYIMYHHPTQHLVIHETTLIDESIKPNHAISLAQWRHEARQCRWLIYSQDFLKFMALTEQVKPSASEIEQLIVQLYQHYVLLIDWDSHIRTQLNIENLLNWQRVYGWCQYLSLYLNGRIEESSLTQDVAISLLKSTMIMKERIHNEITQEEVAHLVGMSRSYFSQCFKRFFGQSFSDILRQLRLEEAKRLLKQSNYSISEIAHYVGFEDAKYFSRTFKHYANVYPSEYRTQQGEEVME